MVDLSAAAASPPPRRRLPAMPLYLVGLGLADEKDITVKGLEIVRRSKRVYLEAYTSILHVPKERLEEFYGVPVTVADRELVESSADTILEGAATDDISFLVVGDPYGATTHTDLQLRAAELNIPVVSIHNASIMNAVACCGLQLYRFGLTVSLVFFTDTWQPDSFYDRIKANQSIGLHTLCLLDIKVKEQSTENLLRGRKIYEPPRYMTVNTAIEQLLLIESRRQDAVCLPTSIAIGVARIGSDTQCIKSGTLQDLADEDFGGPLHSLVLAGPMHELEADFVRRMAVNKESFDKHAVVSSS